MKIGILGSGGIGGYFGGRLAAASSDVTFVARGRHLAAMRKYGLRIRSSLGDLHIETPKTVETIDEAGDLDLVFIGVKLWDTEEIAKLLKGVVDRGAAVISFQNGVQKDEILRRHLPEDAIIGGLSYIAAKIGEPGVIEHSGAMQKLVFGEYGGAITARVSALKKACDDARIDVEISTDIERLIWEKFVFLVGLSGTTSLYGMPIGPVREDTEKRALLFHVMEEVVTIGRAKGISLEESFAKDRLAFCDSVPASMTSSMQVDLERGNRLELPWLSGAVVDIGLDLGIATPANKRIVEKLTSSQRGRADATK